jgi:hypothetical protein
MRNAGEKAMALVDGQLAPADVPGLVQQLARDPSLVAELQTYLALSQSRITSAFAAKGEEPVPAWLSDVVMGGGTVASRAAPWTGFGQSLLRWLQGSYRVPAWSLAAAPAAMALLAVLVGALALPERDRGASMEAGVGSSLGSSLAAALEGTASGKDGALATVRPVLTFNSKSAGWCRQVEVRHASRQVSHALACRGEDGQWAVVSSTAPGPAGIAPAGADRRKAIDDLASSMMRGSPLSPGEEGTLIARRWRPQ